MKFFIYPYTQNSKGAKAMAEELEGKRILREGSNYKQKEDHIVINWGSSDCPYSGALNLNVAAAINKITFFDRLKGLELTPAYATTKTAAKSLGYPVFCRTKIKSRDGDGIVVADCENDIVQAPLYVHGIDKTSEYRVHIGRFPDGKIDFIGAQKKIKKTQTPEMENVPADGRIWSGDTCGFVWKGQDGQPIHIPPQVQQVVVLAFAEFPELTFGGFDVVFDNSTGKAYVIEINSAPMSTPETMRLYGIFFRKYADQLGLANFAKVEEAPVPQAGETVTVEPQPEPEVEIVVPTPTPTIAPAATVEAILNSFVNGEVSIKDLAQGYVEGKQSATAKADVVKALQELIARVQG